MNIDINAITSATLKHDIMVACNEINESALQVDLNTIGFIGSGDNSVLLKDLFTNRGLLLKKINLDNIFPRNIDISCFKKEGMFIKQLDGSQNAMETYIREFGYKRDNPLVKVQEDGIHVPESFDVAIIKEYFLFCRVFGFWELKPEDVILAKQDDILFISVVPTHPVYTGSVEVRV